jgi:hypothetical protein
MAAAKKVKMKYCGGLPFNIHSHKTSKKVCVRLNLERTRDTIAVQRN